MIVTPCLQVRSKSIICYNKFERSAFRSIAQRLSDKKLKEQETYTGRLSPGAKKRLTKAIELIVQAATEEKQFTFTHTKTLKEVKAKFKLNFITLTIHSPEKMIQGKEGHKLCLEPLLLWLRRKYDLSLYVWKAELQERGQLHYHLTTNCFIPWKELRDKWNELQIEAGYLSQYKLMTGHTDANSTDVHSVYKIKDMAKYLKKSIFKTKKDRNGNLISEFNKQVQNVEQIGGKIWDCSLSLKSERFYTIDCGGCVYDQLMTEITYQAKSKKENKIAYTDNCTIYEFQHAAYLLLNDFFQQDYLEAMRNIVNYSRTGKIADVNVFSSS